MIALGSRDGAQAAWGIRAGWALIAMAAIELCAREVAHKSILANAFGVDLSAWTVVAVAAGGAVLAVLGLASTAPLLFALLFTVGVALQHHLGSRLHSDGLYSYAYLRSLAFDGDVNFTNDYKMLGLGDKAHLFNPTPTGYAQSAWTIGPAIVWAPFVAVGHGVARSLSARNPDVTTDGISYPYRQAVSLAGLVYGLLGCWFTWRLAALYFDRRLAAAATAFVVIGSFMLWYIVNEPRTTHAPSMAGAAAFMWMWAATRENRTLRQWALLGALAGFIGLIRWQNVLLAVLPACDGIGMLLAAIVRNDRQRFRSTLIAGVVFTLCGIVAFLPQMLAWRAIYGSALALSPAGPQIRLWEPHVADTLWSSSNGLLSWSPALYVGAIGLLIFTWMRPAVGFTALVCLAVMTWFNASIQGWWDSAGFGGRRFDATIPLFALGAAAAGQQAVWWIGRRPATAVITACVLILLWNLTLMKVARDGHVRIGEPVSFGEASAHQARAFHRWFGHPFTYPASLVFAAQNRVPIGAYDLLAANRLLGDPSRPDGRIDIGSGDEALIGDGWHAAERDGTVTFRWVSTPATLLVPLDHAASLTVQIRAQAFNHPGAPPQSLNASVNGRLVASGLTVPPEWTTIEFVTDESMWKSGVNRVRLEFARAASPADVGLGGDARILAAAIDYVRVQRR